MRYSSTPRMLNLVIFAALAVGFGFLGVYFGFLVTPFLWSGMHTTPIAVPEISVALSVMLGSLGVSGLIIAIFGLFNSIKSLLKKDDVYVLNSFNCYFALGYLLVAGLFLNATWLIRLTTTNFNPNIAVWFVIIVYIVAMIAIMIGTNVPLVRIYNEDESGKSIGDVLLRASFAGGLGVAIVFLVSLLITAIGGEAGAGKNVISVKFAVYGIIPLIGAILALVGRFLAKKESESKLSAGLLYGSLGVYGIAMMVCGIFSIIYNGDKDKFSLMTQTPYGHWNNWLDTTVLSFIFGGLVLIGGIVLVVVTFLPKKEKAKK